MRWIWLLNWSEIVDITFLTKTYDVNRIQGLKGQAKCTLGGPGGSPKMTPNFFEIKSIYLQTVDKNA